MLSRLSLVVLVALAIGLMTGAVVSAQVKIPADFTFEQGKDSPGPVTFSHTFHKEKTEKCQACHTKIFKMKKGTSGPINMERIKANETCGTCHNGRTDIASKTVFAATDKANCEKCHKK